MSGSKNCGTFTQWSTIHSIKKEGAPTLRDSMDGTAEHYAKWNKPGHERQIPYDLTCKWNLIIKTNKQAKYKQSIEIKNKLTVTRGEQRGEEWGELREALSRDMFKGHMDNAIGGRFEGGLGWCVQQGGVWWGENAHNCTWTRIKIIKKRKTYEE